MDASWYYQRELEHLRTLAAEFSKAHPAIAPLLAGPSSDPDVERLLEGTAYLAGQLAQKLDESYDSIAEQLISIVLPQLLRDIPSCAIIRFTPKAALKAPLVIPKGSRLGSAELDGVSCIFSSAYPVELAPLRLTGAELGARPGQAPALRLNFALTAPGGTLAGLTRLRLHMTGVRADAARRFHAIFFHTAGIRLEAGTANLRLPASSLRLAGFGPDDGLFPYPATAWEGYRLLQEYYVFPEKFLFIDVMLPETGLGNAESFSCVFEFDSRAPDTFPAFTADDFALFATPAVNLFPFETVPIKADLKQESYPVRPNATRAEAYVPYLIENVTAVNSAGEERRYAPLLAPRPDPLAPAYTIHCPKTGDGRREMRLFLMPPEDGRMPEAATLSIEALYSNGDLPARLSVGEVRKPLSTSPVLADFVNLAPPTKPAQAPAAGDTLWTLIAHLHLNYLPLADARSLKALLTAYLPPKTDALYANANKRRIAAILSVDAKETDFLWKGRPARGSDLTLTLDEAGFSDQGDLCLFGLVLARFLHEYSPINSFMRVTATDALNRKAFQWLKHQPAPSRT